MGAEVVAPLIEAQNLKLHFHLRKQFIKIFYF